ncbi:MAG: glycerol-3-phosphate 1-O-acyltransferase PlsY [Proteobacteria bacterium]|nr:glycerol-3-phosphate 1-O-acyltransferase PlsY [Pseudomonadota bacterium]
MIHPLGDFGYVWPFYACALAAYLIGSIPFGLVLTRLAGLGDLRRIGSGSIGATNVLRTGNKALAALTVLLDGGKGTAAVLAAGTMGPDMAVVAGGMAVIGHLFPVWLKFRGGKGVATGLGVWLALAWPVGVAACATWLAVAALTRYSSLAGLIAICAAPFYALQLADRQRFQLGLLLAVLIVLRHHTNIRRLVTGQEPKIGRGA